MEFLVLFIIGLVIAMIILLFVAGWLVWELTPLQDWIGTGKSYWQEITGVVDKVSGWAKDLGSGGNN